MPFVTSWTGPSTSPILLPRKGIFVLRHAQPVKIIGGSGLNRLASHYAVLDKATQEKYEQARTDGGLPPEILAKLTQ
jgi:hypothetical protein